MVSGKERIPVSFSTCGSTGIRTYTCTRCAIKTEPLDLPAGNVDGSNQVDAVDVIVLMKHLTGDTSDLNARALDLNGDNRTDILNIIRLIRWLADKDIPLN